MELFNQTPLHLNLEGADIVYYAGFLQIKEATRYFHLLEKETVWQQDNIKVFGKVYAQPRLTALYADNEKPYAYSNITMYPRRFTLTLSEIKRRIEETISDISFTTCLLNLYRDGKDSNGWHADNEKELGKNPIIASVSLGGSRVFKLRHKDHHHLKTQIVLDSGSLLLMQGETQHHWQHQIPKTTKPVDPRINLTFRVIN